MAVTGPIYPPAQRQGSGFVNLGKYLTANNQAPLGNAVAQGITSTAQEARKGLGTASEQFQGDVSKAGFGDTDAQKRQNILRSVSGYKAPAAGEAPNIISDSDTSQFQKYREGGYTGPTELAQGTQLGLQAQEAEKLGKATGSETGRFGLLSRFIGGPQYNLGQKRLDEMILGKQTAPLNQAARQTAGLSQEAQRQQDLARSQADVQASKNAQFAQETKAQLGLTPEGQLSGGEFGKVYDPLQARLASDTTNQANTYQNYYNQLQSRNLSHDLSKQLGLEANQRLYGIDPTAQRYLSQGETPTLATVATPEEQAKIQALSQLAGVQNTYVPQGLGTYDPSKAVNLNLGQLRTDIAGKESDYNTAVNQPTVIGSQFKQFIQDPERPRSLPQAINELQTLLATGKAQPGVPKTGIQAIPTAVIQSRLKELTDQYSALQKSYNYNDILKRG